MPPPGESGGIVVLTHRLQSASKVREVSGLLASEEDGLCHHGSWIIIATRHLLEPLTPPFLLLHFPLEPVRSAGPFLLRLDLVRPR